MKWKGTYHQVTLILVLVLGFFLRLFSAISHSLSNDELSAIHRLRFTTWSELLELGVMKGDMHPAGVQVFMKVWTDVFGMNEWVIRFPFIIFGTVSIYLIFLLGKKWRNYNTGITAAILLAFLTFPIIQSELARPYSIGLMLVLVFLLLWDKLLFDKEVKPSSMIAYAFVAAAGMYTHYFLLLVLAVVGIFGLIFIRKSTFKRYLLANAFAIILFLPHIKITLYQLSVGGLQWLSPPETNWLLDFVFFVFNESLFLCLILLFLTLLGGYYFVRSKQRNRGFFISAILFIGIYLIGHFLSYALTPILKFPVMLFALPFLFLVIGIFVDSLKMPKATTSVLVVILISSTLWQKDLFQNTHYGIFKEITVKIEKWENELGKSNINEIINVNDIDYLNFYAKKELTPDFENYEYGQEQIIRNQIIKEVNKKDYLIMAYSARNTPVQYFEIAREFYPTIIDGFQGYNCAVYLMSKKELIETRDREIATFKEFEKDEGWRLNHDFLSDSGYITNSENVYGPEYFLSLEKIDEHAYPMIKVSGVFNREPSITLGVNFMKNGDLMNRNNEPIWMGFDLDEMLLQNGEGYFAFNLSEELKKADELKISFWNRSGEPFVFQEIQIINRQNYWNDRTY